jgi:hypothetical protein
LRIDASVSPRTYFSMRPPTSGMLADAENLSV